MDILIIYSCALIFIRRIYMIAFINFIVSEPNKLSPLRKVCLGKTTQYNYFVREWFLRSTFCALVWFCF